MAGVTVPGNESLLQQSQGEGQAYNGKAWLCRTEKGGAIPGRRTAGATEMSLSNTHETPQGPPRNIWEGSEEG